MPFLLYTVFYMHISGLDPSSGAIAKSVPIATRAAIGEAAQSIAAFKNVPLSTEELPRFVDLLIKELGLGHVLFSCMDSEVIAARSRVINYQLDVLAIARVMELVTGVEGRENVHDPVVQAVTREIMEDFEKIAEMTLWPATFEMVEHHYAGKLRGPTTAVRKDGTLVTRWWKGLELHRSPAEGPASIEVRGNYRREEYWVEGKRHRPWLDGPADIITDLIEGKAHRVEAYWFDGRRHRPHTEGPARIVAHYTDNTNLSGEEYYEYGKRHRPSSIGPASTDWDTSGRITLLEIL